MATFVQAPLRVARPAQKRLAREALSRLIGEEEPTADEAAESHAREEEAIEKPISLAEQRIGAVIAAIRSSGARRVLDLGCGEGRLLRELLRNKEFAEIVGLDVSHRALEIASQKLRLEDLPRMQKDRIRLIHGYCTKPIRLTSGFIQREMTIKHDDARVQELSSRVFAKRCRNRLKEAIYSLDQITDFLLKDFA